MATSRSPAILIAVLAILVVTGSVVLGPMIRRHFKNKQLMTSGVAATATILEVVDTGSRANHNPVVRIRLQFPTAAGGTALSEIKTAVSPVGLQTLKPGATVDVKYDPSDPSAVAIVTR